MRINYPPLLQNDYNIGKMKTVKFIFTNNNDWFVTGCCWIVESWIVQWNYNLQKYK